MRNLLRTAAAALAVFTAWVGPHSSACPGERDLLASFGDGRDRRVAGGVAHAGGEGTLLVRTGADLASLPAAPPR